ncbi:hypothetical protein [Amedibacillus sp. YH-ame10]
MNNILNDEECKTLNKLIENQTRNLKGVNFIRFFTCKEDHKCSIIIETKKTSKSIAFTATTKTPKIDENDTEFYYGLHPYFSSKQIIKAIAKGTFRNQENLHEFANCHATDKTSLDSFMGIKNTDVKINFPLFKLHIESLDYLNSMFIATLVKMAYNFGFIFKCADKEIISTLKEYKKNESLMIDIVDNHVYFPCGIQENSIRFLSSHSFGYIIENDNLLLVKDLDNFNGFYKEIQLEHYVRLLSNSVYYSGVMPRTIEVSYNNDIFNNNIDVFTFICERTTFATLDIFDNAYIIDHPLLATHKQTLNDFFDKEDEAQKYLTLDYTDQNSLRKNLNEYLKKSPNTHTIAISGNIETKDKYLIIGKREGKSIDSDTFYPSVNGQTEFRDEFPEIYKTSVYEDYPTLNYNDPYRIDFEGEIQRETFAELNAQLLDANWVYYGFSFLMINNENKTSIRNRRMHFNIIAKNYTKEEFSSIVEAREYATERFENQKIVGLKINSFSAGSLFLSILNALNDNWNYIVTLMTGIIILYFGYTIQDGSFSTQIQSFLSVIGILITTITLAMKFLDFILRAYKTRWMHQYIFIKKFKKRNYENSVNRIMHILNRKTSIHSFFRKFRKNQHTWSYHALTQLMIILYYIYQNNDTKKLVNKSQYKIE